MIVGTVIGLGLILNGFEMKHIDDHKKDFSRLMVPFNYSNPNIRMRDYQCGQNTLALCYYYSMYEHYANIAKDFYQICLMKHLKESDGKKLTKETFDNVDECMRRLDYTFHEQFMIAIDENEDCGTRIDAITDSIRVMPLIFRVALIEQYVKFAGFFVVGMLWIYSNMEI